MATIRKNLRAEVTDNEGITYTITDNSDDDGYIVIETHGTEIAILRSAIVTIIDALKYVSEPA